jgi:hypothetical protein
MLTKDQAKIVSDALLQPNREKLKLQIAGRQKREARSSLRQKARAIGGSCGGVLGVGIYFALDRLFPVLIVAPILGCLVAELLAVYKAQQDAPADVPASRSRG